jgi:hypothetical protein
MQYERASAARTDEVHRYFPEWADRPDFAGLLLEADHNSYLAGGYSEEFGYRAPGDRAPVFPPLAGDPDGSRLWCVQIGGLHPGYPQCPRPHDRESLQCGLDARWLRIDDGAASFQLGSRRPGRNFHEPARAFRVIRVGDSHRDDRVTARISLLLKRLKLGKRDLLR